MKQKRFLFLGLAVLLLAITACGANTSPAAGSFFSGEIDMGDKASSGTISFKISEDGISVTAINITLLELKCNSLNIERIHDNLGNGLISITSGGFSASIPAMGASQFTESQNYHLTASPFDFPSFSDMGSVGQLEGKFSSATDASGTIKLYIWAVMTDRACELGEFTWKATSP